MTDTTLSLLSDTSQLPSFPGKLAQTHLQLPPDLPFSEWESVVLQLSTMEKGVQWWLGDALNYGERAYGEMYAQAIEETGFNYQRLSNYKWVSKKFEFSTRVENLSWSHHREVAELDPKQRKHWLEIAQQEELSVSSLRSRIESSAGREFDTSLQSLQIETPPDITEPPVSFAESIVERLENNPMEMREVLVAIAEAVTGESVTPEKVQKALSVLSGHTANIHVSDDGGEWYTPSEYVEAVRNVLGTIELDPASTKLANQTVQAKVFFTKEDDGLNQEWKGKTFLHPPHSMPDVAEFIKLLLHWYDDGRVPEAICLINSSSDSPYFQSLLKRFPVCFTQAKVKFANPEGKEIQTRQGQAFFYLGTKEEKFWQVFSVFGVIMKAL